MAQYVMFYKPRGYLTACRDRHRPTIMELLPQGLRRLHPVGRLDRDTEGLLLLTDDGTLDNRLLQPRLHVEKEYFFAAFGTLDDGKRQRLEQGLYLPGDPAITRPARLTDAAMTTLAQTAGWLPRVCNRRMLRLPDRPVATGVLTIREGRKHQVRRMLGGGGLPNFLPQAHRPGRCEAGPGPAARSVPLPDGGGKTSAANRRRRNHACVTQ